jgi:pimeloyl-ACP methyl ester carboxylesterase
MFTTERDGTRIAYDIIGDGPAIVLTHSILFDHDMWSHQVPVLREGGWRVINIDLRGHGQSPPVRQPFTIYDLADDVIAVLDAVGVDQAVWCGQSVGGMLSLRAAARYPERVQALVLAGTAAGPEGHIDGIRYRAMALWNQLFGLRALQSQVTPLFFGVAAQQDQVELVAEHQRRWAKMDRPTVRAYVRALVRRDDIRGLLPLIDVPTLVLVGEHDEAEPVAKSQEIANGLPKANLAVIPDAGHLAPLEQPESVTRLLVAFLRPLAAGSSIQA